MTWRRFSQSGTPKRPDPTRGAEACQPETVRAEDSGRERVKALPAKGDRVRKMVWARSEGHKREDRAGGWKPSGPFLGLLSCGVARDEVVL